MQQKNTNWCAVLKVSKPGILGKRLAGLLLKEARQTSNDLSRRCISRRIRTLAGLSW